MHSGSVVDTAVQKMRPRSDFEAKHHRSPAAAVFWTPVFQNNVQCLFYLLFVTLV